MAIPTGFKECNLVLNAAEGDEDKVGNLPIFQSPGNFTGSVWELSEEEKAIIAKTGKVFVCIVAGGVTQPPVYATAYDEGTPQSVLASFVSHNGEDPETNESDSGK